MFSFNIWDLLTSENASAAFFAIFRRWSVSQPILQCAKLMFFIVNLCSQFFGVLFGPRKFWVELVNIWYHLFPVSFASTDATISLMSRITAAETNSDRPRSKPVLATLTRSFVTT